MDGKSEKLLGERVVKDTTNCLKDKYYKIYFDNYFTSVDLMSSLKDDGILACGTVRKDRASLPKKQKGDKDMKIGDSEYKTSPKNLCWVKWKDKKPVHFLSNFHDPSVIKTTKRRQKDGSLATVSSPKLVGDYNENMGFVDKADAMKSYYQIDRKSKKW